MSDGTSARMEIVDTDELRESLPTSWGASYEDGSRSTHDTLAPLYRVSSPT
jgi:hypothetical protein